MKEMVITDMFFREAKGIREKGSLPEFAITLEPGRVKDFKDADIPVRAWGEAEKPIDRIPTIGEELEGRLHPETGVPFHRKQVELEDRIVEGVFPEFDPVSEVQLPEDKYKDGRQKHNQYCNRELYDQIESNPDLRSKFTDEQVEQIKGGKTPDGYIWHHHEEPGRMQLVERDVHSRTGHTGGERLWGRGSIGSE